MDGRLFVVEINSRHASLASQLTVFARSALLIRHASVCDGYYRVADGTRFHASKVSVCVAVEQGKCVRDGVALVMEHLSDQCDSLKLPLH